MIYQMASANGNRLQYVPWDTTGFGAKATCRYRLESQAIVHAHTGLRIPLKLLWLSYLVQEKVVQAKIQVYAGKLSFNQPEQI